MILMYHHVSPAAEVPADPEQRATEGWSYNLEPQQFDRQLHRLESLGYRFISLKDYVAAVKTEGRNPDRGVVITFDDGWLDNYVHAFPILRAHGIPAAFFIVSGAMWNVQAGRRMETEQLLELAQQGMTIGAHTRTHCDLTALSAAAAATELQQCREELEARLQRPVQHLAYPGGRFSRTAAELARSAGFESACSSLGGGLNKLDSLFWLHRDILSPEGTSCRDRLLLHPLGRQLLLWRARRRMPAGLAGC